MSCEGPAAADRDEILRALGESEERYRSIVDGSPMGLYAYRLDPDDRLVFTAANAAADRLTGADSQQFVGKTIEEAFPPLAATEIPAAYRRVCRTGESWRTDQVIYEDERIAGAFEVHAFRTGPNTMAVLFLEITERKRAEARALLQRDLAQGLAAAGSVEQALELCASTAIDGRAADAGAAYAVAADGGDLVQVHIAGVSADFAEAMGRIPRDLVASQRLAEGTPIFGTAAQAAAIVGAGYVAEGLRAFAALPASYRGTPVAVLVFASRAVEQYDEPDRAVLETVAAQLQGCLGRLHEANEQRRLAALVEASSDVIGILAPATGRLCYLNRTARELVGLESLEQFEQLAGLPLEQFAREIDLQAFREIIAAVQRSGRCSGQRRIKHHRSDRALEYTFDAFGLPGSDDVAIALTDVTAQRQAETALIAAERRAAEEQAQLQQQLAQSQKMEAIGRLAGGVAHDFNNLLTGISGYAEMILLQLDERSPEYADAQEIRKAAARAASLTSQLLAFSRKQLITPQVLDLNQIVPHSQRMLGRIIGEDIELRFFPGADLWRVAVDPTQIDQILVNLATNARDALPEGGKLTIETQNVVLDEHYAASHAEVVPGEYVMLAVSDDGEGMDAETLRRACEPFFSTKEVGRGTGLGLSTVYGVVRQAGGVINLYSELGSGTTAKAYFPRVEGEPSQRIEVVSRRPRGVETVLVVEDEAVVRNYARRLLERHGYQVLWACDGPGACDLGDEQLAAVDLLLTDVVMPKMNGRQLFDQLRTRRPTLRVLYMSGYTENVIAHHGVLEEGTCFIQKPFAGDALLSKVRETLDSKD